MTGHGRGRCLAVGTGNAYPELHAHQLAQHLAARNDRNTGVACAGFRILVRIYSGRMHHNTSTFFLPGAMPDKHTGARLF